MKTVKLEDLLTRFGLNLKTYHNPNYLVLEGKDEKEYLSDSDLHRLILDLEALRNEISRTRR